jgi:hypothetical protein
VDVEPEVVCITHGVVVGSCVSNSPPPAWCRGGPFRRVFVV